LTLYDTGDIIEDDGFERRHNALKGIPLSSNSWGWALCTRPSYLSHPTVIARVLRTELLGLQSYASLGNRKSSEEQQESGESLALDMHA